MEQGRPTKYKEEYDKQAYKLCLLGYTDKELGDFFGVDERTINNWKIDHDSFFQSIKDGKENADCDVADSLYNRAKGINYREIKIETLPDGSTKETTTDKYIPPDTGAAMAWLKNRQPKKWRDKQDLELSGNMNHNVKLTAEEREKRIKELKEKMSQD